jgi:hypothetical protein
MDSDKPKHVGTSILSLFNTLNSTDVVFFIEDLGVTFNYLKTHKCSIIEEVQSREFFDFSNFIYNLISIL